MFISVQHAGMLALGLGHEWHVLGREFCLVIGLEISRSRPIICKNIKNLEKIEIVTQAKMCFLCPLTFKFKFVTSAQHCSVFLRCCICHAYIIPTATLQNVQ